MLSLWTMGPTWEYTLIKKDNFRSTDGGDICEHTQKIHTWKHINSSFFEFRIRNEQTDRLLMISDHRFPWAPVTPKQQTPVRCQL